MFDQFQQLLSNDMGIDLGTSNTLVHVKGQGIVLCEPSVVAMEASTRRVIAVGSEAKTMLGKTPGEILAVRPMKDGVISDYSTVEKMIKYFIKKVHNKRTIARPRIVIGIPSGITEVEKRAVRESVEQAGAREVWLVEEAMAAALGANLPIQEPAGHMIVDIGGGTTEIAVLSLGGMVRTHSIRVGGDEFDDAIINYLRKKYSLIVGEQTAEEVKIRVGTAFPDKNEKKNKIEIKGRDAITGLPRTLVLDSTEVRKALLGPLNEIIEGVKYVLDQTPPELAADICDRGIVISGGGSMLKNLDMLMSKVTNVPCFVAENPLYCVALGTGRFLDNLKYQVSNRGLA